VILFCFCLLLHVWGVSDMCPNVIGLFFVFNRRKGYSTASFTMVGSSFRDKNIFYKGGIETIVYDIDPDAWKRLVIKELVRSWGYDGCVMQ